MADMPVLLPRSCCIIHQALLLWGNVFGLPVARRS